MQKPIGRRANICGVRVSSKTKSEVLESLGKVLVSKANQDTVTVVTPNPEQVVQAREDDTFRHILNRSSLAVADGVGLIWAAKILEARSQKSEVSVLERYSGRELAEDLIQICAEERLKVMIVGGKRGVAEEAARRLKEILRLSGSSHLTRSAQDDKLALKSLANLSIRGLEGAKDIRNETREERERVFGEVRKFKPKLLLVAYGAPAQEKWIWENREVLEETGVRVAMVVGGAVDVWAGRVKLAPSWLRKLGLEWLWRLIHEPWRWKRQIRLIEFVGMVLKEKVSGKS